MGLSCKQVCSDGLDWSETLLEQPQTLELPKPAIGRRQHQNQQQSEPLNCPRCDSTNTKFCYYNNYNKSQPRHFCKSCKRHWTKGGTLRNVPVGGGRKNKRLKTSKFTAKAAANPNSITCTSKINRNMINPHQQKQKSASQIMLTQPSSSSSSSSMLHHNSISCNNFVSNNGVVLGSTLSLPQNHFPSSNSSSFETKPSLISTCFQNSNVYNYSSGETMEDSIITTIMPTSSTTSNSINHHQHGQVPNAMDITSYWNWDDLDNFVSTSDLNIMPWDHKP